MARADLPGNTLKVRKMKRIFKNLALVVAATLSVVACQKSELEQDNSPYDTEGTVLYATTANTNSQTKITFSENDTDEAVAIDLAWEDGDEADVFTVYNTTSDALVGDFKCTDASSGKFSAVGDVTLTDGATYTAIYPASTEETLDLAKARDLTSTQKGDQINNLDDACYMLDTFEYSEDAGVEVEFDHQMAIMTFTFTSSERPAKLVFENGEDVYTVTYSDIEDDNGYYTSHIMVEPCSATSRELTFSLYATSESEDAYDVRTVTSEVAYLAGYRYTAPVSDLDPTIWLGSGTEGDPYQITTAEQLQLLATNVNNGNTYEGQYFIMTKNIDLSTVCGKDISTSWTPIGDGSTEASCFSGQFDGKDFKVSGLYINSDSEDDKYVGLFGALVSVSGSETAAIKNLSVSGNITATSADYVGGVVGLSYGGAITNCSNSCTLVGGYNVGGVAGCIEKSAVVRNCSNSGSISSSLEDTKVSVGGVIGYITSSEVVNCSNSGTVEGYSAGGLAGLNYAVTITNCYNTGKVSGYDYVGGLAGYNTATITNCYNAGEVEGSGENIGGFAGSNSSGSFSNCYWDSSIYSGNGVGSDSEATGVEGASTTYMKASGFVTLLNNNAATYNADNSDATQACAWKAVTSSYPTLDFDEVPTYIEPDFEGLGTSSSPYLIENADDLVTLATNVNGGETYTGEYFLMTDDIALTSAFTPIGVSTSFQGNFDGGGHEVSGLSVDLSSFYYAGLFGYISGATIQNLGVDGKVNGIYYAGGIAACSNSSTISNCYNLASITASSNTRDAYAAGIVAYSSSDNVINCYNMGAVSATSTYSGDLSGRAYSGGIAGYSASTITNCYSVGAISAESRGIVNNGAIVGYATSANAAIITNCYWNSEFDDGTTYAVGDNFGESNDDNAVVTSKTSSEMKNSDFVNALNAGQDPAPWVADSDQSVNGGYPILSWQVD